MKAVEMLPQLPQRLGITDDPAACQALGQFVHQVVHDLNNPLGTLGIELYSLEMITQQVQIAMQSGDHEGVEAHSQTLVEVLQNLKSVQQRAGEILNTMEQRSASWSDAPTADGDA